MRIFPKNLTNRYKISPLHKISPWAFFYWNTNTFTTWKRLYLCPDSFAFCEVPASPCKVSAEGVHGTVFLLCTGSQWNWAFMKGVLCGILSRFIWLDQLLVKFFAAGPLLRYLGDASTNFDSKTNELQWLYCANKFCNFFQSTTLTTLTSHCAISWKSA